MASVSSHTSPHSLTHDFESTGDDESWQYLDYSSNASAPESVGFLPSPASGSLSGFALVGHAHPTASQSASPLFLVDVDQTAFSPGESILAGEAAQSSDGFLTGGSTAVAAGWGAASSGDVPFVVSEDDVLDDVTSLMATFGPDFFSTSMNQSAPSVDPPADATAPSGFAQDPVTTASWYENGQTWTLAQMMVSFDNLAPSPHSSNYTPSTSSVSPPPPPPRPVAPGKLEASPSSFPSSSSSSSSSPSASESASLSSASPLPTSRAGKARVKKRKAEVSGRFVIMTPNSIHAQAQAGQPKLFECSDAMRCSRRGRKGPLPSMSAQDALEVRRLGACYYCNSRKVKCDTRRPCQHCKRLMLQVPQVVCWRFQDFLPVLFPDFIRAHLRRESMAAFLRDNMDGWLPAGGGTEPQQYRGASCSVDLFSGPRFGAVLSVQARFFVPKTCEVLQHWHLHPVHGRARIQSNGSAPIGVELDTPAQRDDLRKRVKAYVQNILREPCFAEQVTDSLRSTRLPWKVLRIVQTYARQSGSHLVKRALAVYAMHYIMTRHLCLTSISILALRSSGLVPQNTPWVTARVLSRQVKSLIDELIMREMEHIFDAFAKTLRARHRREWAPCTAAFLVLCLFMEAVETTAENFALAQNEIRRRNTSPPEYVGDFALNVCRELENLPFKQFAYRFHSIFQTHDRDATATAKSFNPLFDDGFMERGELDEPAADMVRSMRELFYGENWRDLQFLADDELILHRREHARPIESSFLYTGRLVAKFLLSFTDENIIFGGQI
ncbi:hypothetical protein E4U42_004027 [Claviceps africana]|uniref:Zn(2)-C6 fungal-type domain-containing protein n=1 Tax=Claviceps africana TaxID=83212 RepID=A0A8K0J6B0_9HYPO|nr:hypothetical protein E4U42_004027 [Claviceps africana]